jgi:GNAT superfamily N-acetyltransferase
VDPEFNRRWEPGTGFFGYFECMPDAEACEALLACAEDALRTQGMRCVVGPINLTTNDEVGLLVEGFERRPAILSPYNPRYYKDFLEAAGYITAREYHAFEWSAASSPDRRIQRLDRLASRAHGRLEGLVLRAADPKAWEAENRTLFELFNASFEDRWGFVPLSWDEYREQAERFRPFYRPELAIFAEAYGTPIGFGLALPDVNEALALVHGRLLPLGWLRLKRALPRIRSARLLLLAVRPEYAGAGVGALIAARLHDAGVRLGLERGELSLIEATNRPMIRVVEAFGCPRISTFRLYEKFLG